MNTAVSLAEALALALADVVSSVPAVVMVGSFDVPVSAVSDADADADADAEPDSDPESPAEAEPAVVTEVEVGSSFFASPHATRESTSHGVARNPAWRIRM